MRWIILVCVIIFGLLLLFNKNAPENPSSFISTNTLTPTPHQSESIDLDYKGVLYRVSMVEVQDTDTVSLFLNLKDKLTLSGAKEKNNCRAVISGGFYSKTDTPIGFFRINNKTIQPAIKNALFNGYISISQNVLSISDTLDESESGLQTGPLLIVHGERMPLRIRADEPARRMVATITNKGQILFLALYDLESTFDGPLLADLPDILNSWSKQAGIAISEAINLDGGSASGMISDDINLGELTYVGSYFCIR